MTACADRGEDARPDSVCEVSMRPVILAAAIALSLLAPLGAANAAPDKPAKVALPATPAWVAQSNAHAQLLVDTLARFQPEFAGRFGVAGLDREIMDLKPGINERAREAIKGAAAELRKRRERETHPKLKQDLDIMIAAADRFREDGELNEKYLLPYYDISQSVFSGLRALLDDQVEAKRREAALVRLKRYTGLESGYTPLTELAKARTSEKLGDAKLLGPYKEELDQGLSNTARYVDGIKKLFGKYKLAGADEAIATLEKQLSDYDDWLRSTVSPRARTDNRLPEEMYAFALKQAGLDIGPDELIPMALLEFAETRKEMEALAPLVAKDKGIAAGGYREVLQALKKQQLDKDAIVPFYEQKIAAIEAVIRREHIVTLPQRPMQMRLASEAESAQQPAPHMDPPPMIGNKGERGTFVLPLVNPAAAARGEAYDDFTNEALAWTLTAHEGRPGHELQFSAMVENGVSLARTLFAFNSVNVEGWALYSEAEMKPYEPLEGQLGALQNRLLRAARAFLDPMVNLGRMTPDAAREFLIKEVVVSPAMARQEVDRYTFRAPGQATSYFYGYTRLMQLRVETELKLGPKFDRQTYHDFILAQGLLPPKLLREAVLEEFVK
jgi:uncharacterized protein (DUF885 family)